MRRGEKVRPLVYIKRIDLRGFKTFGKKAAVHLDRGLTIITGPNGSGKSNILDSVKFALGELSPKELRGETIGDLIHKGGQDASSRSAYVAVSFDNSDRRIPIDSEAVTISREFRHGGEGIYRLNGRRISRKQLTDILSSADIQVSSYNIVPQHAITRLAEVTTEERRRIIEDMIGIAIYDTRKASAQAELQQADLNLKVASARIEEVRLRVESLERERNNFLKYQQVRQEIGLLQAKSISYKIKVARKKTAELEQQIIGKQQELQDLKAKRDRLIDEKKQIEEQKREYENSVAEKGSTKLIEIQGALGDVNASIAGLKTQVNSIQSNIKTLQKQKAELERNSAETFEKISASKKELHRLRFLQSNLSKKVEEKQAEVNQSNSELTDFRTKLGEYSRDAEGIEQAINAQTQRIMKFNAQIKASATRVDLLQGHLKTLRSRKEESEVLLQSVTKRVQELNQLRQEEAAKISETDRKLDEYAKLKEQRTTEIKHAGAVARRAKLALVELETQKTLAENLASDEKALALIEDMAASGAAPGVYGRLGRLIKIKPGYEKAAEAAAAGWMKALVVKDVETAVTCIEMLKKNRVGRIKLIPLETLKRGRGPAIPRNIPDVLGPIADQITCPQRITAAVDYVFGDTVLATHQKAAFLASVKGVRAVAVTGDLYEPGGAMETGYYRRPFDVARILLNGQTVEELKNTLASLERLATKATEDVSRIEQELTDLNKSKARSHDLIRSTEKEIEVFSENLNRVKRTIEDTDIRIENIAHEIGTEQTILEASVAKKAKLQPRLDDYVKERGSLKLRTRSAALLEKENQHANLTAQLNDMLRQKIETDSRIESLTSTLAVLEPSAEQFRIQQTSIDRQTQKFTVELSQTQNELAKFEEQLKQLQKDRDRLTRELDEVKAKRDEFDSQVKNIDSEITRILDQLDPISEETAELTASLKQGQMQAEFHFNELKELGFADICDVSDDEIGYIEENLEVLKKELSTIGGVNELAVSQYEEVKDNYKHLASRIYELEKEKLSILQFMNELDRQKHDTFMKAFNQVSRAFHEIFSTVTGGVGRLFLERPDAPFDAGADIRLQFPGKTEMTIGAASGGEKSVGTVCFILALQAIHPMPFYMMDEIDAHLDVVNSQRLAELLKSKSMGSQFIVVSLKDVTISRGDSVYGVFIQEGTSQVVSLPMQEVKAHGRTK